MCRHCETVCPTQAIQVERDEQRKIWQNASARSIAPGVESVWSPVQSQAIVMVEDSDDRSLAQVSFPYGTAVTGRWCRF